MFFPFSGKFLVSVIYTKKKKTCKRYVLRTFFLCFVTRTLCSTCFCSQRERERERERERGGVSLSLEQRAHVCDENHCISFFFIAKNEKFGLAKRTQRSGRRFLNRVSDENVFC